MRNAELVRVTGRAMQIALQGFPLSFVGDWDYEKLACRVKAALTQPISQYKNTPNRTSNAHLKSKISVIARYSKNMLQSLNSLGDDAEEILSNHSNYNNYIGYILNSTGDDEGFRDVVERLQEDLFTMQNFLEKAALNIKIQKAKWRQTQVKNLRVKCAEVLIGIFKEAFEKPITLNNWADGGGDALHKAPTAFMIFCQRMMEVLFNEKVTKNLIDILKEARAAHDER